MQETRQPIQLIAFFIGILPFMVNGWINAHIATQPVYFWSFELFSWVLLPCLVVGFLRRSQQLTWADFGLHLGVAQQNKAAESGRIPSNLRTLIMLSIIAFFACNWVYKGAFQLSSLLVHTEPLFEYESITPTQPFLKALTALYFGLTAGIVEEIYYRGLCFKITSAWSYPQVSYLVLSPLLFASSHWEQGLQNVLATWLFGLAAALFYMRFRNLWPLIIGHVATDYFWFS